MILSCKSCKKKFVVPDQAITDSGRIVQCGSCGNKWKQFPIKDKISKITSDTKINTKKLSNTPKTVKPKKKKFKKEREFDLYSPEYLAKKHGITLNGIETKNSANSKEKVSFGFYNYLLVFIVIIIALSKGLHFFQYSIVKLFPFTEFYLNYFFESIRNIFEIWKNLISNY